MEEVKRGRGRPRSTETKNKFYFHDREEKAVVDYIQSNSAEERNEIFRTILKPAFTTLVESIIRRYKLQIKNESFQDTFDDALCFIFERLDRFDINSGYKAYSFFGTVCKNHLIIKSNETKKMQHSSVQFEEMVGEFENSNDFYYEMYPTENKLDILINKTTENIQSSMMSDKMTVNERLIGKCLVNLLDNWEELFSEFGNGSNKLDKSTIIQYISDTTSIPIKDVKIHMKKFKNLYFNTKKTI